MLIIILKIGTIPARVARRGGGITEARFKQKVRKTQTEIATQAKSHALLGTDKKTVQSSK